MMSMVKEKIGSLPFDLALIISFTFLMVLSAQIRIPLFITPVPLTLQTFVLFLSLTFLRKKAAFSQMIYAALGLSGFSVFAGGGFGVIYLLGPTGGYILGFLFVAALFPFITLKRKSFLNFTLLFSLATLAIYCLGMFWLVFLYHSSLLNAFNLGVFPFLPGDFLKISLAAFISYKYFNRHAKIPASFRLKG